MEISAFSELIHRLTKSAIESGPEDHEAAQIEFLKDTIPFDSAWWGWSNFTAGKNRLINTGTFGLPSSFSAAVRAIMHTDPLIRHGRDLAVFSKTIHVGEDVLQPDFERTLSDFQINAILSGHCRLQGDTHFNFFLSLYRCKRSGRFTETEARDFRFVLRHLEQNLSLSLRAELRALAPPKGEAAFICIGGAVIRTTRGFNARLVAEGLSQKDIAHLIEDFSFGRNRWENEALVVEGTPYRQDWILVTLSPKGALLSLPKEERVVAELLIQGFSVREIAQKRCVSPNTVRNQIASIYRKTGVNSRAKFLNRARLQLNVDQ
ncbi:MAG: LuxR C-terminal-related transcriptional regulator [Pseudomonadota bacterium]